MKTFEDFLTLVKKECKKNGVKISIRNSTNVKINNYHCSGYFHSEKPTLVAAKNNKLFKSVLAHEYAHLTQWKDNISIWVKSSKSLEIVDKWLLGEKCRNISKHLSICRDLELDNEIRTSKFIEEYDMGINLDEYIKKSNAYILYYNWLFYSRKWCSPENSPYNNKRLINAMSNKFDMNYKIIDSEILNIFKEERI